MKESDYLNFEEFFREYVKKFYSSDKYIQENIILKEEHTYRVLEAMNMITEDMELHENSCLIARTTALFHDIGRFEQFARYQTFNDAVSENHAELSVKVLEEEKILDALPLEEKDLIIKAMRYHNTYRLPPDECDRCLMFAKLLRDADKIDIFKVLTDYYKVIDTDPNPALEHNLLKDRTYCMQIVEDILNHKNSNKSLLKTRYDMRLFVLTWIFDINYNVSLKIIKERNFTDKILKVLPHNEDMNRVKTALNEYTKKKLD
ncbi:MAG: HD domain-containing protein [Clostridiaceae bacterium]